MESVMRQVGGCGLYQIFHVVFTQAPRFAAVWSSLFMMFGSYNPGWRCARDDFQKHDSINSIKHNDRINTSRVTMVNGSHYKAYTDDRDAFTTVPYNLAFGTNDNESNSAYFHGNHSSRDEHDPLYYNGTCVGINSCRDIDFNQKSSTIVTEFELICDRSWLIRMILFTQGLGQFIGPLVVGQVGETFGRRKSLYGCTAIIGMASLVAIFSTHWFMFAVCYFFIGGAGNGIIGIVPVYAVEFLNNKWRGFYGSLPTTSLAAIMFSVVTLFIRDWIHVHIITVVLCLIACTGFFFLTESPRWLIVNGRVEEAEKSFSKIAKINRRPEKDTECVQNYIETIKENVGTRKYYFGDIFRNRELFRYTVKFSLIALLVTASYFSVTFGISSLPGDYYINAIQVSCVELVVGLASGPLCNIIGRRKCGVLYGVIGFTSSLVMVLALVMADEGDSRDTVVKISAFLAKSSAQGSSVVFLVFSSELYPTAVRNLAAGLLRSVSGIGGLITSVLSPAKDTNSLTLSFSIMCAFFVIIAVLFSTFPETRHCVLGDELNQTGGAPILEEDANNTDTTTNNAKNDAKVTPVS